MTGIERTAYDVAISFGLPSKPEASINEKFWLIWEISVKTVAEVPGDKESGEGCLSRLNVTASQRPP